MENSRLLYFKDKLFNEKKKLLNIIGSIDSAEEFGSLEIYYNELSHYDNHPADISSEVFMKEQDQGFKNNLREKLNEINDSLDDINNGNYGICKICNKEINKNRLETIPYVKTCLKCSDELSTYKTMFESVKDKYITSYSDNEGSTIFDREDAYQDIAENEIILKDPSFSTGDYMGIADEQNENEELDIENISQKYYDDTLK
ncbi:MAG: hypothetical protein GX231_07990 [Tissierellia bacterium]|nr:hypothetical protein [Tissierellia bacterium]